MRLERARELRILLCAGALALAAAAPASADVVDDNVAATVNGAGKVELFARGSDGSVYTRLADDGVWSSLGGSASSGPAAMTRADGTLDVFVRGSDEAVYQRTRHGSTWSDWTSLGGVATSAPAATERRGTGHLELFVRASDNTLMHRFYRPGVGWSPDWAGFGGQIASAPTIVSRRDGWADLFVRWSDNRILGRFFDGSSWSDWFVTPGANTLSAPSATVPSEHRMQIFYRGLERALWYSSFDGQSYAPVVKVDDRPLEGTPSAVADPAGRIRLYARSGQDVLVKTLTGGGWSQWSNMGPVAPPGARQDPSAPAPAPGTGTGTAPPSVATKDVELATGLSCTPRGQKLEVSASVRKRPGRAKPRVRRVVFFYRKGKGKVARTDRRAPYRRMIPVDLAPGTHRVFARIYYKRPGKRALGRKTVSRRFVVCAE